MAERQVDPVVLDRFLAEVRATLTISPDRGAAYDHMGAVLADAGLQAATTYATVVAPRVANLQEMWPSASTTSAFLDKAFRYGLGDVLRWKHPEKLTRVVRLGLVLQSHRVESTEDLAGWLQLPTAAPELRTIPGIGPKTVDYLAGLVGLPAVAIDRHVFRFAERVGHGQDYDGVRSLLLSAADALGCSPLQLDRAIWMSMSSSAR